MFIYHHTFEGVVRAVIALVSKRQWIEAVGVAWLLIEVWPHWIEGLELLEHRVLHAGRTLRGLH